MPAFPEIQKIKYEGPQSKNPLAFRWYNESEVVEGKTMKEQLRFAVVYWHTFRGTGSDPFGSATMVRLTPEQDAFLELALKLAKPRPYLPVDYSLNHGHYVSGEPKKS